MIRSINRFFFNKQRLNGHINVIKFKVNPQHKKNKHIKENSFENQKTNLKLEQTIKTKNKFNDLKNAFNLLNSSVKQKEYFQIILNTVQKSKNQNKLEPDFQTLFLIGTLFIISNLQII